MYFCIAIDTDMEQKKQEYKPQGNMGLFDDEHTLEKLNDMGNPLDRLSGVIDFEMFREILEKALHKDKMTKAGAKPYDPVLMFKILVLQRMYHLSDAQTEYQIRDRLSFRNFLGLASGDRIPDQNTVWLFREELVRKNVFEQLFQKFYAFLEANNLIMKEGVIVDGSFVEVPRQRNSREENKKIKEDKGGELWNAEEGDTENEKKTQSQQKAAQGHRRPLDKERRRETLRLQEPHEGRRQEQAHKEMRDDCRQRARLQARQGTCGRKRHWSGFSWRQRIYRERSETGDAQVQAQGPCHQT